MTIGKRKGYTAKGAGAQPGQEASKRVGGSLSKGDHFYIQEGFGMLFDPGIGPSPSGSSGEPDGHSATGGKISDWVDPTPGKVYRAHIFTGSGFFNLTSLSGTYPADCEYLVVAGGGGGGYEGGGGAGGLRTNLAGHPRATPGNPAFPVSVQNYIITVGAGGAGRRATINEGPGNNGAVSSIKSAPGSTIVESTGGGGAGWHNSQNAQNGGSGGGSASNPMTAGTGSAPPTYTEGYPGGQGPNPAGGGGGAGGAGVSDTGPPTSGGHGGIGVQVLIAGNSSNGGAGAPGPGGPGTEMGWFAGGGGGAPGANDTPTGSNLGPQGGGGPTGSYGATPWAGGGAGRNGAIANNPLLPNGSPDATKRAGFSGAAGTGGGGGGCWTGSNAPYTGSGGSGTVIIRYQIGVLSPNSAATGGAASYWSNADGSPSPTGSWIHVFTNSGQFVAPGEFNKDVTWALVGGGGGGGGTHPGENYGGGGGGAGGYRSGTATALGGPFTAEVTIGAGGICGQRTPGSSGETAGKNGWDTKLVLPAPAGGTIIGYGGGGGGGGGPGASSSMGGSGGGGGTGSSATGAAGINPTTPGPALSGYGLSPPYAYTQGYVGGWVGPNNNGDHTGGGGGAGGVGKIGQTEGGAGGIGVQLAPQFRNPALQSPDTSPNGGGGLGTPGAGEPTTPGHFWVGGGGGGGRPGVNPSPKAWNAGGGGQVSTPNGGYNDGTQSTGGGGSGRWGPGVTSGQGGSGIVVIAYPA